MGYMKRLLDLDWTPIGKAICVDCITSPPLKKVAEDQLTETECDYCERSADVPIAASTDDLMEHIDASLKTEWTDPANVLPYETAKGGYQGQWFDTWELFEGLGEDIGADDFVEDVVRAYGGMGWCDRDYFGGGRDEQLKLSWDRFAELVKYQSRFVFMRLPNTSEFPNDVAVGPAEMLSTIGELVAELGIVRAMPAGTEIYRARLHPPDVTPSTAGELAPPPRELARSGRMSPTGIPLFYGALDAATAVAEVIDVPQEGVVATVGRWTTAKPLSLVDLADLPETPSIFDEENRHLRAVIWFLRHFSEVISRPTNRPAGSEQDAVEYVPSQIVTDYFRNVFALEYGISASGLIYRSARTEKGICVAIFADRDACVSSDEASDHQAMLVLRDHRTEHVSFPEAGVSE